MLANSFSVHLMWKINQSICLAKIDKISLIVFWNLQGAFGRFKNQESALANFDLITNLVKPVQRDAAAINKPSLMARISVWMGESASTYLAKWRRTLPWWSLKIPSMPLVTSSEENDLSTLIFMVPKVGDVHEIFGRETTMWGASVIATRAM